jgi:hypothetical protein
MSKDLREKLILKINELTNNQILELTEDEVKYCITRWIEGNYREVIKIENVKLYHYTQPNDPNEKEMIGAKILRSE